MVEDKKPEAQPSSIGNQPMSEGEIDRNLDQTFPASDPPSWTLGTDHHDNSPDKSSDKTEEK
jgi:hypothetical protein